MKIYFEQKKPGRLRPSITPVSLDITLDEASAKGLIAATVRSCVEIYNQKVKYTTDDFDKDTAHPVKTDREIEDLAESGKVAFGFVYDGKPIAPEPAVANALQCYADGLFRIFLNGSPLGEPDQEIEIKEGDTLTVVRLTMLAGRMW